MSSKSYNILTKFLLGALILLMIAGVAVWGVNDILIGSGNKTLAKVGNSRISDYELENMVQNNKMQLVNSGINDISEEFMAVLRNNAMMNLIGDRLLQSEFHTLNIQLDEKEVLKRDYLSQPDFDKEKLKAVALSMGGEEFFLRKISKEKKIDFLQGSITAINPASDGLVKAIYDFENQTRDIEYIELNTGIVKDTANPSNSELLEFYEKNKDNFISPEYRDISYIVLDKNILKVNKDAATELHEISNELLDKVAGGETLEEVAKNFGLEIKNIKAVDPTGKHEDGTSAAGFPEVMNFLAAIFATEQDEISDILESDDGKVYAFIRVDNIREKRIKALDEVRGYVTEGWKAQNKAKKLVEISKQLKEELDSGKTTIADFAANNGLEVKQMAGIGTKNAAFPPEFITDIFATKTGKYGNLNRSNNGSVIIAKVTAVNAPATPEKLALYEYKSKIQEQMSQEIMAQYLDYLRNKYNVSVYNK